MQTEAVGGRWGEKQSKRGRVGPERARGCLRFCCYSRRFRVISSRGFAWGTSAWCVTSHRRHVLRHMWQFGEILSRWWLHSSCNPAYCWALPPLRSLSIEEVLYLPFPLFSHEFLYHLTGLPHSRPPATQPTPARFSQSAAGREAAASSSSSCKESEDRGETNPSMRKEKRKKKKKAGGAIVIQLF